VRRARHCYMLIDGIAFSLYPEPPVGPGGPRIGLPRYGDLRDVNGECEDCKPKDPCTNADDCIRKAGGGYPIGDYQNTGPNSNTFAYSIFTSCCQTPKSSGAWSTPGYDYRPPAPIP